MSDLENREFIKTVFDAYLQRKLKDNLYDIDSLIPENIIRVYASISAKYSFSDIMSNFKKKYIDDESKIENNTTREDKKGLGIAYDYISSFDFQTQSFNLFTILKIHQLLYSAYPAPEFGGTFRSTNVVMPNSGVEIPSWDIAQKQISELYPIFSMLISNADKMDIILYIDQCIQIATKIIAIQPFLDGNKRSARTLLNLMLKRRNIPPIFITPEEQQEYSIATRRAIVDDDPININKFYYYKICDSIIEFDISKNIVEFDVIDHVFH